MPDFYHHNLDSDSEDGTEDYARSSLDEPGLVSGDRGAFTTEQRLALRGLLQGPFISGTQDKERYQEVVRSAGIFSTFLDNLMLELIIDEVGEIAYLRDWELLPEGAPSLFRRATLSHIQTTVVLNLRKKLAHTLSGERTIVDANHIFEETLPYQPSGGTDQSKQRIKFDQAWNNLAGHGVMKKTAITGRWEVSPVLASIFSAEEIAAANQSYRAILGQTTTVDTTTVDESMEGDNE